MGEAKRRKAVDPTYGTVKPGLIVSCPLEIDGTTIKIKTPRLDPQELRFSLLFWDRLVWPSSRAIHFASGPDEQYLERLGILSRPDFTQWGDAAQGMAKGQIQAFVDLDRKEPGQWSLAQGESSFWVRDNIVEADSGVVLALNRALPVPNKDVPFDAILELKRKRRDELQVLRNAIDISVGLVSKADDKAGELDRQINLIDKACADALKVFSEWQFPFRMSSVDVEFDFRPLVTLGAGISSFVAASAKGLPFTDSILTGLLGSAVVTSPALKIKNGLGWKGLRVRPGPYRYVSRYHDEVFGGR